MSYMEQELYYILGNLLKKSRENAGLTLTEVSEKMKTTPMTIQRYEKGDRKISVEKVRELCSIYGQDSDQIMKLAVDRFKASSFEPETLAAHHDDEDWTAEELAEIEEFKNYVRSKRK